MRWDGYSGVRRLPAADKTKMLQFLIMRRASFRLHCDEPNRDVSEFDQIDIEFIHP